jgi:hypothetical protein
MGCRRKEEPVLEVWRLDGGNLGTADDAFALSSTYPPEADLTLRAITG